MKKIFILIVSLLILAAVVAYMSRLGSIRATNEFALLVKKSSRTEVDLRELKTVAWDEFVVWTPYANICDYGIKGFEKGGKNCRYSTDDGECYLLLLKENELIAKIPVNRKEIDLATSNLQGRVKKERALLRFVSKNDWPKVQISPPVNSAPTNK